MMPGMNELNLTLNPNMTVVNPDLPIRELLKIAADNHHKRIELSDQERVDLIALIKKKAGDELEFGEELELDSIRLVRRVTGAVGLYFNS